MYLPAHFAVTDVAVLHDLMEEEGFGLLLASGGEILAPAPFVLDRGAGRKGRVRFHVARANPVVADLERGETRLVVSGPHGYVSPQWYATRQGVPTWNYVVVVARGTCRRLDAEGLLAQVRDLAARNEAGASPWSPDELEPGYRAGLLGRIVGFEMPIEDLVGKFKLSQNRDAADRDVALAHFRGTGDPDDARMARWMARTRQFGRGTD